MLWFDCWYLDNLCTYKQVSGHEDYKVWYENRWMWPRSVKKGEVKQKKERGGGEQNKEEEERAVWKSVWSVLSAISDSLLQWNPHDSCNNNMLCEDLACCRELFQQLARSTVPRGNEIIMITMVQILQGILNILIAILKLEFQRTHTLCAPSMHFQSTACMCSNYYTSAGNLHCTAHASCLASFFIACGVVLVSRRLSLKFHPLHTCEITA